jgi:hypothetical protein
MRNNIVVSNSEAERVSPLDILWTENSSVEATYKICALEGEGNFEESIDIFRVPYEDFRLCYDFLWDEMGAMDKGDNAAINQNRDLAGNKRIVDNDGDGAAEVDLGAYEQEYIEVTFNNAHPQAGVEYGSVSGDNTEQWILRGSMADVSNIEVTPVDGWEFDYWETLDHTRVDSADPFYSSTNLYGVYKQKQVQVSYEYDPNKLQIAAADSGLFETIDQDTAWFITHTNQYASPNKPRVGGKNGWVFAGWTPDPESVSEDTVMTADVGPTAIYYFGTGGYYDDGSKTALWTTDMCNPLYSPNDANIVTPRRFEFVGWSETAGGEAITLPSSITQPERFYAVYEKKQVTLTVDLDGKGTFTADPSGDYDYGTKLDLNNSEIMDISPDSGLYCIGFTDEEGKNIHLPYLTLKEDVTITAQYAAVPSGNLIIENSIVDGFINTRLALNMGFIDVNSTQAVKPNPDGSEDLLSLIIPQSHTGFAGFEAEENGNDLTLTALYTNPYYRLMLKFFR